MASSGDSNQRSAPVPGVPQPSFNTLQFGTMSDSQLRQTINQLSHAASGAQYQAYAAPTPQRTAGKRPAFSLFLAGIHHRAAYSLPEKHRQLVYIFDSSTSHVLTAQPPCEKQQSCTCACTRNPSDALSGHRPAPPGSRIPTNSRNPPDSRGATTTD
jgi:hypothetical protein